jgi:hypothetical protein
MSIRIGSNVYREQDQAVRANQLPFTHRVWQKAWHSQNSASFDSICAKIACIVFPIILTIAAGEGVIHIGRTLWNKCRQSCIPPPIGPRPAQPPIFPVNPLIQPSTQTLQLQPGSSQYDIAPSQYDPHNNRPPACTFHSLNAISSIARDFDRWADRIQAKDSAQLSQMQQQIIKEGLRTYRQAVVLDPTILQGANFEHIKNIMPQLIAPLHLENTNQDMQPVPVRSRVIADWLFSTGNQKNIAWLKTANEESFAIVCYNGCAIFFDSHKNEITLTVGKEPLIAFLNNKLLPHSQLVGNFDINAFSYALGRIEGN